MNMKLEKHSEGWHNHFHSIRELEDTEIFYLNRAMQENHLRYAKGSSWWGVQGNYPAVKEIIQHGWKDGLAKMRKTLGKLSADFPAVRTRKRRQTRAPQGNELDIHRVYAGDLQRAWRTTKKVEVFPGRKQGKRVTLAVELIAAAQRTGDVLFWRGATAAFLAEQLTKAEYSVEVLAVMTTRNLDNRNHRRLHVTTITLKSFEQRLNLEAVVAATALSGFYRSHGWHAQCTFPMDVCSSMGECSSRLTEWIPPLIEKHADHMVYIRDVWSEEDAVRFIKQDAGKLLKQERKAS